MATVKAIKGKPGALGCYGGDGGLRIVAGVDDDDDGGLYVAVLNPAGKPTAQVTVAGDQASLQLFDDRDRMRLVAALCTEEQLPAIKLLDEYGRPAGHFFVGDWAEPNL
ncbi:MAG: hypothetical protein WD894_04975 [Pirellulales bacterium]